MESPEIDPLIFGKGAKAIAHRKASLFKKWCWNTGHLHGEK